MMLVVPIDDVDIYKKRDRLIVKVYYSVKSIFHNWFILYSIIMIFFKKKRKMCQILNMFYIIGDRSVFIQIKKMKKWWLLVILIEKSIIQYGCFISSLSLFWFDFIKDCQVAKERLREYFENGPGRECQIDHLYFEQRFVSFINFDFLFLFIPELNVGQLLSMKHLMNRLLGMKRNHFIMIYLVWNSKQIYNPMEYRI